MRVTVDQLSENPIEQMLCSESHADNAKSSKRIMMYADVKGNGIWFDILVNGNLYGQYKTINEAVEEYNQIS